jgi:hypothetical protein
MLSWKWQISANMIVIVGEDGSLEMQVPDRSGVRQVMVHWERGAIG